MSMMNCVLLPAAPPQMTLSSRLALRLSVIPLAIDWPVVYVPELSNSRSIQLTLSAAHKRSKAASAVSVKPWRLRKL